MTVFTYHLADVRLFINLTDHQETKFKHELYRQSGKVIKRKSARRRERPAQTSNVELAFKIGQGPTAYTDLISVLTKNTNREFEMARAF